MVGFQIIKLYILVNKLVRLEERVGEGPSPRAGATGQGVAALLGARIRVPQRSRAIKGQRTVLLVLLEQNRGGESLFLDQSVVELLFSGGSDTGPPVAGIGLRWRVGEALYGFFLCGLGCEAGAEVAHLVW